MHQFAVILGFDRASEEELHQLQNDVATAIDNTFMEKNGMLPHITLAMFLAEDYAAAKVILADFATNFPDMTIRLGSIGIFNTPMGVVTLQPVVTKDLLAIHDEIVERLSPVAEEFVQYYLQPIWVPHCSVAINVDPDRVGDAVNAVCERFSPFDAKIRYLTLAECCPYKECGRWPIGPEEA